MFCAGGFLLLLLLLLHVSCVGASCSSVLQVSKIKTSCWSSELSIKVNVPQEIGWGTRSLKCSGPPIYPGHPPWAGRLLPAFLLPCLATLHYFLKQMAEHADEGHWLWTRNTLFPATIYPGNWGWSVMHLTVGPLSKSLMFQVFLPILGSVGDHIQRPNMRHRGLGAGSVFKDSSLYSRYRLHKCYS